MLLCHLFLALLTQVMILPNPLVGFCMRDMHDASWDIIKHACTHITFCLFNHTCSISCSATHDTRGHLLSLINQVTFVCMCAFSLRPLLFWIFALCTTSPPVSLCVPSLCTPNLDFERGGCWRTRVTHARRTVFCVQMTDLGGSYPFRNRQSKAHSFCFSRKLNPHQSSIGVQTTVQSVL